MKSGMYLCSALLILIGTFSSLMGQDLMLTIEHIGGNGGPTATISGEFQGSIVDHVPPFEITIVSDTDTYTATSDANGDFSIDGLEGGGEYCIEIVSSNGCLINNECYRVQECFIDFKGREVCDQAVVVSWPTGGPGGPGGPTTGGPGGPGGPGPGGPTCTCGPGPGGPTCTGGPTKTGGPCTVIVFVGKEKQPWTCTYTVTGDDVTYVRLHPEIRIPSNENMPMLFQQAIRTVENYQYEGETYPGNSFTEEFKNEYDYAIMYHVSHDDRGALSYELIQTHVRGEAGGRINGRERKEEVVSLETVLDENVLLNPNPASYTFQIEMLNKQSSVGLTEINMFDNKGRKVLSETISESKQHTVKVANLLSGVYSCVISFSDNSTIVKQFVKI